MFQWFDEMAKARMMQLGQERVSSVVRTGRR